MKRNKILIIGSGRLGSSIAQILYNEGNDVTILDTNINAFARLEQSFGGFTMVGDATNITILDKAEIDKCREVIIVTGDDNINLYLAHICFYIYNVPNIYVRMESNDKMALIENTTIRAIYPFMLSVKDYLSLRESENL